MSTAANLPPDTRPTDFADMSAALTGFTIGEINPINDPLDRVNMFLQASDANATGGATAVSALLAAYVKLRGQGLTSQQIANSLLDTAGDPKNPSPQTLLARQIVSLWYFGAWYGSQPKPTVISSNAYIGGLAWQAMQAHPMGNSDFTFGYWTQPPPPLSDFGVDVPPSGGRNG
jgi:hypothetical protein